MLGLRTCVFVCVRFVRGVVCVWRDVALWCVAVMAGAGVLKRLSETWIMADAPLHVSFS